MGGGILEWPVICSSPVVGWDFWDVWPDFEEQLQL